MISLLHKAGRQNVEIFKHSNDIINRISEAEQQAGAKRLNDFIDFVCKGLGVKPANMPEADMKAWIWTVIIKRYHWLTFSEFKLAFELAMCGELNLPGDEVKCYNDFNVAYVTKILNAYKLKRTSAIKSVNLALPNPEVFVTDEQKANLRVEFLKTVGNMVHRRKNKHGIHPYMINQHVYECLLRMQVVYMSYGCMKRLYRKCREETAANFGSWGMELEKEQMKQTRNALVDSGYYNRYAVKETKRRFRRYFILMALDTMAIISDPVYFMLKKENLV